MDRDPPAHYGDAFACVVVTRGDSSADTSLASARAATTSDLHAVVVHSGTDPSPGATLVIGEDAGRAAAVNRAVAGLPAEVGWVAVADPDVVWPVGGLDALRAVVAMFPRAGLVAPALRSGDRVRGRVPDATGSLPSLTQVLRGRVPAHAPASPGPVGWVSGRAMLVRRSAWDSVDGYDPRHLGPLDDVDLCDRLARAGWQVVHVPTVEAVVGPRPGAGILEAPEQGFARYAGDRFGTTGRLAAQVCGWVRSRIGRRGATSQPVPPTNPATV